MAENMSVLEIENRNIPTITPIAIIGLASIMPEAAGVDELWQNVLNEVNCIKEIPASRWSLEEYYDPDPNTPDKSYSKYGGFIPDIQFDPIEFGLPPNILEVTDVSQLLSLIVAKAALKDAGYLDASKEVLDQTGVILGMVGMSSKIIHQLLNRLQYPIWESVLRSSSVPDNEIPEIIEKMKSAYIEWNENAFPGAIGNVVAGRIANRLDLGGANCIVDAACASSLAAVSMAVSELALGKADMMVTGGVDTDNSILTYLCFSKTPAFSKGGKVCAFSEESDGMLAGEGIGMLLLKRLTDAERDGDRIYAVIRGVGASSDGHFKSIYAPRSSGQSKAIRRAYMQADYDPGTVRLVEAHGTGTNAGDPAEFNGLLGAFSDIDFNSQVIALGSIKSQIGHTKATAGAASLIKTSLALHQKILPATINVSKPHPNMKIEETPFYLNTETRPWFAEPAGFPRRAGVSSFGFGGTNFHIALEEYKANEKTFSRRKQVPNSVVLSAENPKKLLDECRKTKVLLEGQNSGKEFDNLDKESAKTKIPVENARIGFVAPQISDALDMLAKCIKLLESDNNPDSWSHPSGIYYRNSGMDLEGKVVALFPGQGSQYLNMGKDLALNFPPVRIAFEETDMAFLKENGHSLSRIVFPIPVFSDQEREDQKQTLTATENAQPAIGTLCLAMHTLLANAGFHADHYAGHSFGELTALCAASVYDEVAYTRLAIARGKAMGTHPASNADSGSMLAVKGDSEKIKEMLGSQTDITIANYNSPEQLVLAGSTPGINSLKAELERKGLTVYPLNVSAAFHTPFVAHAQAPFKEAIQKESFKKPKATVYSNSTGMKHDEKPEKIAENLENHMLNSVNFKDEIENIYQNGGRVFIEIGPKKVLTNLVSEILGGKSYETVALNANPSGDSDLQLRQAVVQMRVLGFSLGDIDPYRVYKQYDEKSPSKVSVALNGGLYTSQKTKDKFQKALSHSRPKAGKIVHEEKRPESPVRPAEVQDQNGKERQVNMSNNSKMEPFLKRIQDHQKDILNTHQQFLANDAIAKQVINELITAEISLLSNAGDPGKSAADDRRLAILENRAETINHQQSSIADAHKEFVLSQANFTKQYTTLIAQLSGTEIVESENTLTQSIEQKSVKDSPDFTGDVKTQPTELEVVTEEKEQVIPVKQANSLDSEALKSEFLNIVSDKTGYPTNMLEFSMDMEADLGIDSIKRVEILGAMQEKYPDLPTIPAEDLVELRTLDQITDYFASSAPESTTKTTEEIARNPAAPQVPTQATESAISNKELESAFLGIVSDKTGYPTDMLELGMDMEADLGIDSIKRVEILGAMQEQYPSLPTITAEDLVELRTLKQIIDYFSSGPSSSSPKVSASPVSLEPEPKTSETVADIEIREAKIFPLPKPDYLDFQIKPDALVIITDDGNGRAEKLADHFTAQNIRTGLVHFGMLPNGKNSAKSNGRKHYYIPDGSDDTIKTVMENIVAENKDICGFIHLVPHQEQNGSATLAIKDEDTALLKTVFLIARHLGEPLSTSSADGRSVFLAVTSVDGKLGISGSNSFIPVSGGYAGLTKSLRLEWPDVFCRTIDVHPEIKPETFAEIIQSEMHDPDLSISEVGYTPEGRFTIIAE